MKEKILVRILLLGQFHLIDYNFIPYLGSRTRPPFFLSSSSHHSLLSPLQSISSHFVLRSWEFFPLTIGRAHLSDFNFFPLGGRALSWQTVWNYWGGILIEFGRASYSSEENTWEVGKLSWEIRGGWEEMCEVVASSPRGYFAIQGSLITHTVHEQYDMSLQLRMSFQR